MSYKPPARKSLSKRERQTVYDKCGGYCAYCGTEITMKQMQVDHVIPVGLNGENTMENYLPACRSCNYIKSTLSLEGFRNIINRWPHTLARDSVTYKNAVRFGVVTETPHEVVFYFEQIGVAAPVYFVDELFKRPAVEG